MLFSIIIPVYQAEKYLPECLRSIEEQTCQDFEVILVNDGSTDGSVALCEAFEYKYHGRVTILHKENGGCLSARRVGIAAARGQYSLNIDADDLLDTYCLEILRKKLEQYEEPDMIIFRMFFYFNGRLLPDVYHPDLGSDIMCEGEGKQLIYNGILDGTTINSLAIKLIRTSLLSSDPTIFPTNYGAEDLLQSLYPLTYAKRVLYTNEPLYYYRYNPQSVTNSYQFESLHKKNNIYVYNCILQYLPLWGLDTPEARDTLSALWVRSTLTEMKKCFRAAKGKEEKMAVLRFPWYQFVDMEHLPKSMSALAVRCWRYYLTGKLDELYREWSDDENEMR